MKTYLVGGAVRDALMGLPVRDRDWVVVGATPQDMQNAGFKPVGRDFPVFLHPHTKEEYALARTERKTGTGYRGFVVHSEPGVTLEEDLARRDLTINSIAVCAQTTGAEDLFGTQTPMDPTLWRARGALRDPYGGQQDIADKALRHVTASFHEDPVRILRVARFAARFSDFHVAPATQALLTAMVARGEADHLVAERVWQEFSRGLMEVQPTRMFAVLRACGALAHLMPELDRLWGVPQSAEHHPEVDTGVHVMMVLNQAAQRGASLAVRWACLVHDLGKGVTPVEVLPRHLGHEAHSVRLAAQLGARLRVPLECRELAAVVAREHGNIHRSAGLGAAALVRLLERCDAIRQPQRFAEVLLACECDARGRLGLDDCPYPQAERLATALQCALAVATDVIAAHAMSAGATGKKVGDAIRVARIEAIAEALVCSPHGPPADC